MSELVILLSVLVIMYIIFYFLKWKKIENYFVSIVILILDIALSIYPFIILVYDKGNNPEILIYIGFAVLAQTITKAIDEFKNNSK